MIIRYIKTIIILFTANINFAACATLSVDQIINRYIEAIGGTNKIEMIDNLIFSQGLYQEKGFTGNGDASMSLARPYFKLVGNKNDVSGYMEGYNGSAWEYYSDYKVVVQTVGAPSEAIRHYAGVEHPLFNYREKGSSAEYQDQMILDEHEVYVIKLTRMDGFTEYFYIDVKTFLINATSTEAPIHAFGESVAQVTRISDYRPVNGILIPHKFETVRLSDGERLSSMTWGKIEANKKLPADWFSPPAIERTPENQFIEKVYQQRTDINAVMWTYKSFRRANPTLHTNKLSNFVGYQMLKMGDVETAIALLKQNVKDYPDQSDAQFALGRAYIAANRKDMAMERFNLALKLDPENKDATAAMNELMLTN